MPVSDVERLVFAFRAMTAEQRNFIWNAVSESMLAVSGNDIPHPEIAEFHIARCRTVMDAINVAAK